MTVKLSDDERLARLEERLGLKLPDRRTALVALTHASYLNEHRDEKLEDNERLEFLGDAVVDLAVSHRLMERMPLATEGELSRLRASVVDEEGLSQAARRIGLGQLLLLGRGEELSGGREKPSLLADAMEAVLGGLYRSQGLEAALGVVDRILGEAIDRAVQGATARDAKTELQELAQARAKMSPRYRVVAEQGPDHSKTFRVEVLLGEEALGQGMGRSKKEAEQAAAQQALLTLAKRDA